MGAPTKTPYDPCTFRALTFHDATPAFQDGTDTPRAYLERCIETIDAREPVVQAFAALNKESARTAADASAKRWQDGKPLSAIDGMPIAIKDLLETSDMPTQFGCEAFNGNFPKRDNAAVRAMRQAGAVIFGKTVTAELGGTHPGPTTNPFDPARTPGGSSSGSAAAVAAGMVPAAIGTQVGGSIIRPAGFCGNVALKPSQGALNRGERMGTSMSTHGPHSSCIEDMWQVAIEIALRVGGDRGCRALTGPTTTPAAQKPEKLMVLETDGWIVTDDATKATFAELMDRLKSTGVTLTDRHVAPAIDDLEGSITDSYRVATAITAWENRWAQRNMLDELGNGLSVRAVAGLEKAEAMTPGDYETLLDRQEAAKSCHLAVANLAEAAITLSCPGPAPMWPGDKPGEPLAARPTGNAVFNYPTSLLGAPVVTIPMLAVDGMTVGVQIIGQHGEDAKIAGIARWIMNTIEPAVSG